MSAALFIAVLTIAVVRHILIITLVVISLYGKEKAHRKTALELLRILRPANFLRRW